MPLRDEKPWVDVKPVEVALVAATLIRDGMDVATATRMALQLIEAATYGLADPYGDGTLSAGVDRWAEQQENRKELRHLEAKLPPEWPDPTATTIPFETAMTLLLPRLKKVDRMPFFRDWLAGTSGIASLAAGELIATFKQTGLPSVYYGAARYGLSIWREKKTSNQRREAGAKGRESKKRAGKK